jgi:hypothetical protein
MSKISLIRVLPRGIIVNDMAAHITPQYPIFQPYLSTNIPIIVYPNAAPKLPIPSIIPVTLDVAYT